MIKEKAKAPLFKLPSTGKNDFNLKDALGNYILIYFYPKDDTPGCTLETNDFNKLLPKFNKFKSKQMLLALIQIKFKSNSSNSNFKSNSKRKPQNSKPKLEKRQT